ncbi:hypothetical protein [Sinorhizobium medicae]
MDKVPGDVRAELLDSGSIEITFAYHNGDEAILKAERETSSTGCQFNFARNTARLFVSFCDACGGSGIVRGPPLRRAARASIPPVS